MADMRPADETSVAELTREASLVRVLDLVINTGKTQAEACEAVGISLRTFQRSIGENRVLAEVRRQTDGILAAGVIAAYRGYLNGIERMTAAIQDPETKPRDLNAMVKTLHQMLRELGGMVALTLPADDGTGDEGARRVQVAFNSDLLMRGPLTMRIAQQGGNVLDGDQLVNVGPSAGGLGAIAGDDDAGNDSA